MNRGVVMQVGKKEAVVMTADGGFVKVPLKGNMQVGEEIRFESVLTERRRPKLWYAGAAAAILLFILPIFMLVQSKDHPVVAYVSMDINPSIEIGVDQNKLVRELQALNKDGEAIIAGLDYEGQSLEKVTAALMKKLADSHYLDEPDKDIVITSMLLNEQVSSDFEAVLSDQIDQAIQMTLKQLTTELTANITTLSIPTELREAASASGVSSGKMAVYLIAKDEGYDIELDNLREQSIDKVTGPIGGVQTIVEKSENSSKEKLKELVQKEKNEKKAATATAKPVKEAAVKPAAQATPSEKPAAVIKPQPTPGQGKKGAANPKDSNKPKQTIEPGRYEGYWKNKDRDNNHDRDDDDDEDDDDKDKDKKKNNWNSNNKENNNNNNNQKVTERDKEEDKEKSNDKNKAKNDNKKQNENKNNRNNND